MTEEGLSAEWTILEANMREFAHNISIICALESGGKLSGEQAYERIKENWKLLKASKKSLFDAPSRLQP